MWTTVQNVKDLYPQPYIPAQFTDEKITAFIMNVETQVKHNIPNVEANVAAGVPSLEYVQSVVATIVVEYIITEGSPYQSVMEQVVGQGMIQQSMFSKSRYTLTLTPDDISKFITPSNRIRKMGMIDGAAYLKRRNDMRWKCVYKIPLT